MRARTSSTLFAAALLGVTLFGLARCELFVDLDRGEVDGALPDGCAICTNLSEAGEEAGADGGAHDPGDASARDAASTSPSPADSGAE